MAEGFSSINASDENKTALERIRADMVRRSDSPSARKTSLNDVLTVLIKEHDQGNKFRIKRKVV
jgi:hypothetical protein